MTFFIIDRERLLYEYEENIKKQRKGILNWFVSDEGGERIINIILDIDNVRYYYKNFFEDDKLVRMMLSKRFMVYGMIDDIEPEEEDTPEPISLEPEDIKRLLGGQ